MLCNSLIFLVPEVGIEPTRGRPRWILSPVRLPVSPLRLECAVLLPYRAFRCQGESWTRFIVSPVQSPCRFLSMDRVSGRKIIAIHVKHGRVHLY